MFRKVAHYLASFLAVAIILLALAGAWRFVSPPFEFGKNPTINVQGEGKVTAKPDLAEISFAVVDQGSNPTLLQALNDKKMAKTIDYLKSEGVKENDIKTTGYLLTPQYESGREISSVTPPKIVGYTLTQTVNAKIRDLASVGRIVGGLTDQGINQINNISFSVDNPEPFKAKAREEAIAKARAQAQATARQLGVKLGKVVSYSEFYPGPIPYGVGGLEAKMAGAVPSPIQAGTQEVTVSVNITYIIR